MIVSFPSARHGTAYRVVVEGYEGSFGIIRRTAEGTWAYRWNESEPEVPGFATRTDAAVGLLLMWGGRGAPPAKEIYNWILNIDGKVERQ